MIEEGNKLILKQEGWTEGIQPMLYERIVLSGGKSLEEGFPDKLKEAVVKLKTNLFKGQFLINDNPIYDVVIGGGKLGKTLEKKQFKLPAKWEMTLDKHRQKHRMPFGWGEWDCSKPELCMGFYAA